MTPAETTANPVVEAPALPEPAEDSSVNWEGMSNDILADDAGGTIEGDVEVLGDAVQPEGFAPNPEVKVEPVTSAEPVVATPTVAEPVKVEPVTTQKDLEPPVTAAPFDAVAWEQEQMGKLTELYQLSDEEKDSFLSEPENTLPKLAAVLHMRITKAVLASVQSLVPQMMAQQQTHAATETAAKSAFYEVNPDLNDPAYESAILQVGAMYRQMNPKAPREEAVKKIGELVRVSMGLSPQGVTAPVVTPPVQQPPVVRPFTPARGGAGANPPPAADGNVWTQLAGEFLDD